MERRGHSIERPGSKDIAAVTVAAALAARAAHQMPVAGIDNPRQNLDI